MLHKKIFGYVSMLKHVKIYTDGACSGNPGPGGWAAILLYMSFKKVVCGSESMTTNNRMELRAAVEALSILKFQCYVKLYTDSKYLKDGISVWIKNWIANGWKTSDKKPVKNVDLWQELNLLSNKHKVDWIWVKGHASNELNIEVDTLARSQIYKPEF